MPPQTQRDVAACIHVLEARGDCDCEDRGISSLRFAVAVVVHQPDWGAGDIAWAALRGVRCAGEDGGERADGFEAQDTTSLDGGFVDGGDIEVGGGCVGVGEEMLRRGEVEGGGCGSQGKEGA